VSPCARHTSGGTAGHPQRDVGHRPGGGHRRPDRGRQEGDQALGRSVDVVGVEHGEAGARVREQVGDDRDHAAQPPGELVSRNIRHGDGQGVDEPVAEVAVEAAQDTHDHLARLRRRAPREARHHHASVAEVADEDQVGAQERAQDRLDARRAVAGPDRLVEQPQPLGVHRGDDALHRRREQRLLRAVVIVDGGHVHMRVAGDRAQRRA
jgi:hypothetical protein